MTNSDSLDTQRRLARIGAVAGILGAPLLFFATLLHPMHADPSDALAAFTEYATDHLWVATHLGQFLGVGVLAVALIGLAAVLEAGTPAAWARIGVVGTAASVAAAAALQAVDGVALKLTVDRWASATGAAKDLAFEAAFAVRQVETGMASLLSVVFGLTVCVFGVAMLSSRRFPAWLAWIGLLGGAATVVAGVAQAYTGFSSLSMILSMPSSSALLVWAVVLGVFMRRLADADVR